MQTQTQVSNAHINSQECLLLVLKPWYWVVKTVDSDGSMAKKPSWYSERQYLEDVK